MGKAKTKQALNRLFKYQLSKGLMSSPSLPCELYIITNSS